MKAAVRWAVRGQRNVKATMDSLRHDIDDLRSRVETAAVGHPAAGSRREPWLSPAMLTPGINVIGYLQHQVGLGDFARRVASLLAVQGVPTAPIAFDGTHAPLTPDPFVAPQRLDHTNSIAVLAADQLLVMNEWHPEVMARTHTVGYCFWELATLPPDQVTGARTVDEIWVASAFTAAAFESVGDLAVRHVPIPIPEPQPSDRTRGSFPPLAAAAERVVFGVTFDHFSATDRKNPIGAIDAFCAAFPDDGDQLLVVKTLNAAHHPEAHQRLVDRAAGRSDVVVWDEHLPRSDQLAFIASLDVLVSLHRGEGLGLHLAEAMWLGVPVIATGYSGNLEFMDDSCARLVRYALTEVGHDALHYPPDAEWADPDLDHAAELMIELLDPATRELVGAAGRARMSGQPGDAATAAAIAALLGV